MSSPAKAVRDVLEFQGELEWARCVGSVEPLRPPFVAWRFKTPDESAEKRIEEAVRCYAGLVEWVVDKGERNRVLQPAAFRTYARTFRSDGEALQQFALEFPSETHAALEDIASLAAYLREKLLHQ
jgi:hypothetical protein